MSTLTETEYNASRVAQEEFRRGQQIDAAKNLAGDILLADRIKLTYDPSHGAEKAVRFDNPVNKPEPGTLPEAFASPELRTMVAAGAGQVIMHHETEHFAEREAILA